MKQITDKQIEKINKHLSKMTESQQDAYIQKLDEAGLIGNILSKFGSAKSNMAKLQKQKTQIATQLQNMIAAIDKAVQANPALQQSAESDKQALQGILDKVNAINVNIDVPEDAPAENNNNNTGNDGNANNNAQ